MKRPITRRIAGAMLFASFTVQFVNCGPAKVSTDGANASADLGSSGSDPSSDPGSIITPPPTVTGPAISVSKTSINFGSVDLSENSSVQTFTITNTGSVALTLSRSIIDGNDFGFANGSLTNVCTNTLAPGATCNLGLRFFPNSMGQITDVVRINSNAPNSPHLIQLSGTGVF